MTVETDRKKGERRLADRLSMVEKHEGEKRVDRPGRARRRGRLRRVAWTRAHMDVPMSLWLCTPLRGRRQDSGKTGNTGAALCLWSCPCARPPKFSFPSRCRPASETKKPPKAYRWSWPATTWSPVSVSGFFFPVFLSLASYLLVRVGVAEWATSLLPWRRCGCWWGQKGRPAPGCVQAKRGR